MARPAYASPIATTPATSPSTSALADDLARALGAANVGTDPLELALYACDAGVSAGETSVVCFPTSIESLARAVTISATHDRPFVVRGSGTGLAGGATPLDGAVVIVTTKMDRIISVDPTQRVAWVEPGVINLDLTRAAAPSGLHYAPDPSSAQACSIGGNVGTNAGGPHCLAYGVTSAHVLAIDAVLADGRTERLGGLEPDQPGLDLRGVFVGAEGTMGAAGRVAVRLTPNPPALSTLLCAFSSVADAGETVSDIIAAGIVPAALEMMDQQITVAVEDYIGAGYPRDAAAVLLVELDGREAEVAEDVESVQRLAAANEARSVRVAADDAERALLWKGRKSAFGAVARIAPDYYLHDAVVPRTTLVDVLARLRTIADDHDITLMNVFHAGDGNLHPLIAFDRRIPGTWERVHAAGEAILSTCLDVGGVLSGEHGIGLEKRHLMDRQFTTDELDLQARVRDAFDPDGLANPGKILPRGVRCGELGARSKTPK